METTGVGELLNVVTPPEGESFGTPADFKHEIDS
jgi:hypothetical protein